MYITERAVNVIAVIINSCAECRSAVIATTVALKTPTTKKAEPQVPPVIEISSSQDPSTKVQLRPHPLFFKLSPRIFTTAAPQNQADVLMPEQNETPDPKQNTLVLLIFT